MRKTLPLETSDSALLIVDMQPDFMPGGTLAVPEGDAIVTPVRDLMQTQYFTHLVATQDWHPANHMSFASQHDHAEPFQTIEYYGHEQKLWPDHCVQGTPGAVLHPDLPSEHLSAVIRKGMAADADSYSGFVNNWDPNGNHPTTGLNGYLKDMAIKRVFVCGLARDVCVYWTALDATQRGYETHLIWDLTRSVDPDSDEDIAANLKAGGVSLIDSSLFSNATS